MMNILSLFDGMSCLHLALDRAGIKVDNYYASEIDKHAIKVTQHNYPETIQLGDIRNVHAKDLPKIDLIAGGSPCQGFSFAGKGLNFNDPRSALFFEFVRLWKEVKEINPDAKFLLENVKMKKEHELVISQYMGLAPIEINSALVSAQNRVRLYWTNINQKPYGLFGEMFTDIPQPKDKGILLKDILEDEVDEKYFLKDDTLNRLLNENPKINPDKSYSVNTHNNTAAGSHSRTMTLIDVDGKIKRKQDKASCFTAGGHSGGNHSDMDLIIVAMRGRGENNEQQLEPNNTGKTNYLISVQKDNLIIQLNQSKESGGVQPYQQNRVYDIKGISPALCAEMSCGTHAVLIPEATKRGYTVISEGECFDFENPTSKTRRGRKMVEKSNCLMANETHEVRFVKQRIRRLTPVECERLQTVPDNFTTIVSDTQRYKMLGNGWTIDVIAHILNYMNVEKFNLIQKN